MWLFTIVAGRRHRYREGVADSIQFMKRHRLVDGQVDNMVHEISGLVWVMGDKFFQARKT